MTLPEHILFVALTRPAINRWGVPHKSHAIALGGTLLIVLWVGHGNIFYWFLLVPAFFGMRELTNHDHNWLRLLKVWRATKFQGRLLSVWGGSHLEALPCGIPEDPKDIAGAV